MFGFAENESDIVVVAFTSTFGSAVKILGKVGVIVVFSSSLGSLAVAMESVVAAVPETSASRCGDIVVWSFVVAASSVVVDWQPEMREIE